MIKLEKLPESTQVPVNSELLKYLFDLQFRLDSVIVNLKILASSRFYEEELFNIKEKDYYELFIEYNILVNYLQTNVFPPEYRHEALSFTYDITRNYITIRLKGLEDIETGKSRQI